MLTTCDIQVEGVHFTSESKEPKQIGSKAIAVNVSDIIAMGGQPKYCMVSLIIPKNISDSYVSCIYDGIKSSCKKYGIQIIGGNISSGKQLAIDIFMIGYVKHDDLLLRSGSKPGDKVLVAGTLGEAAIGFELINNPDIVVEKSYKKYLLERQLDPKPQIIESKIIANSHLATAMIDVSDGLLGDICHLCDQSNVGVIINESCIPTAKISANIESKLGKNKLEFALSGGEDYRLLFTAPEDSIKELIMLIKLNTDTNVSVIGEITPKEHGRSIVDCNNKSRAIVANGWDHLS